MKHYLEKELEDLLKADSKLFKFIQNHSLDGMWYWDLENQNEEYMDERFWHVLGYDPKTKKHSPQEWIELIDPEHLELAKELTKDDWTYLLSVPLYLEVPEHSVVVVHAGLVPGIPYHLQVLVILSLNIHSGYLVV